MNIIYKSVLIFAVGLISVNAMAQRDESDVTRQVMLERDYNPTLNEATKITTEPNIFTPKVQSAGSVKFLDEAPQLKVEAGRLGQVASGDIMTDVPFSQQRFYLNFGAGSHGILDGNIGVRAVDARNDKLDIFASYSSMSGNVKNIHSEELFKDSKAKFSDLKANVKYQHKFEPSIFNIGASYQNLGYNYYGSPFVDMNAISTVENPLDLWDMQSKQKVDVISFNAGLKSSDTNEGLLKYEGNVAYTNFSTKYGSSPAIDKGPRGGIIQLDGNFYTQLGIGNVGIAASILNQSFTGKKSYELTEKSFDGFTNLTANPYYRIEELTWDLTIGANVSYVLDVENKFVIAPNVKAQFHINDVNTLYANVTGGVNNNTFIDILQENRYATPVSRIGYSKTPYDIQVGFKSGAVSNLEFELFGGYKQVKNDHQYVASTYAHIGATTIPAWSNLGVPLYADVSTGHFGGLLKTKLIPMTTLTAKAVAYFYDVKGYDEVFGRPTFTTEINADIKPIDKLTLSLSYLLMTGRKGASFFASSTEVAGIGGEPSFEAGLSERTGIKMKAISELNIRAEYEIVKEFSVFARVNNLLDQKYEYQLGYSAAGLNVLGGISLKF